MSSRDPNTITKAFRSAPKTSAPFPNSDGTDLKCGDTVVFPCPEGFALGYLTGRNMTIDDGIRMSEVRLRNGHTFVIDEYVTVVPNEAAVMPVVGQC